MINKFNNTYLKKILTYYLYGSLTINSFFYQKDNHNNATNIIEFFDDIFSVNYTNCKYELPILGTFIPQGLTLVNDNIYITAYDGKMKKNSVIFEIHDDNTYRIITLDTKAHVGGITFDEINNLFWICDTNGTISSYSYEDVITKNNVWAKVKKLNVDNNDLLNHKGFASVAYITFYDNYLFVGNYSTNNNGILKRFKITENGNIDLSSVKIYKTPNKVQGVAFYEDDNTTYILFSISYGLVKNSNLAINIFNEDKFDYSNNCFISYVMPRMMEEIIVDDDNFIALFESNAYKYRNGITDMDKLYKTKIKQLIKKD